MTKETAQHAPTIDAEGVTGNTGGAVTGAMPMVIDAEGATGNTGGSVQTPQQVEARRAPDNASGETLR